MRIQTKRQNKLVLEDLILINLPKTRSYIVSFTCFLVYELALNFFCLAYVLNGIGETLSAMNCQIFGLGRKHAPKNHKASTGAAPIFLLLEEMYGFHDAEK